MPPIHTGLSTAVFIVQVLFRQPCVFRFRGYGFPVTYRRHYLVAEVLGFWLLNRSTLSSTVLPEPQCRSCDDSLSMGDGHSTVAYSLCFDQL